MRRTASMAAVLLAVTAIAGCRSDRSTGPAAAIAGSYQMTTMNGAALPYTISAGSLSLQVTRDVLVLNANGSYADSTTFAIPNGKALQTSISIERGSFRYGSDGSITFSNSTSGGTSYGGHIAGTTLTESVHGTTPVYERR